MEISELPEARKQRFWDQVKKGSPSDCWIWRGAQSRAGAHKGNPKPYGYFSLGDGRRARAHRFAYELLVGPIPAGQVLDHRCRNTLCVNPCHLEPLAPRENTLRGQGITAVNARLDYCSRGHPFDADNTRTEGKQRRCLACRRLRGRVYDAIRRNRPTEIVESLIAAKFGAGVRA